MFAHLCRICTLHGVRGLAWQIWLLLLGIYIAITTHTFRMRMIHGDPSEKTKHQR